MSTPTDQTPVPPIQETIIVVEAAPKFVRTKTFVKKTFTRVGVPVLIGTSAAWFVTRGKDSQSESNTDTVTPTE